MVTALSLLLGMLFCGLVPAKSRWLSTSIGAAYAMAGFWVFNILPRTWRLAFGEGEIPASLILDDWHCYVKCPTNPEASNSPSREGSSPPPEKSPALSCEVSAPLSLEASSSNLGPRYEGCASGSPWTAPSPAYSFLFASPSLSRAILRRSRILAHCCCNLV